MNSNKRPLQPPTDKQLSASSKTFQHALKMPLQRSPSSSQTSLKLITYMTRRLQMFFVGKTLKNMLDDTLEDKLASKLDDKMPDVTKKKT